MPTCIIFEARSRSCVDNPMLAMQAPVARGTGIFLEKLDVFSRVLSTSEDD